MKSQVEIFQMLSQKAALKLEIAGFKHSSGRSIYQHIKDIYNLKGNRTKVLEQFTQLIKTEKQKIK